MTPRRPSHFAARSSTWRPRSSVEVVIGKQFEQFNVLMLTFSDVFDFIIFILIFDFQTLATSVTGGAMRC